MLCKCKHPTATKDNPVVTLPIIMKMVSTTKTIFQCLLCGDERKVKPIKITRSKR